MEKGKFADCAIREGNVKWNDSIKRQKELYDREDELRSPFYRDYNRILHCMAFRRLKHKTQVFFATHNDHICTRMEHVNHVMSISYDISSYLGLNTDLTLAIAIGHDIGHAPFGHAGETILRNLAEKYLEDNFWHEKNGLRFADKYETLQDPYGNEENLNLTYAVRDGIISHCGEIEERYLKPRDNVIDLYSITKPNEYSPFTWEGCVVKISDKIAFIGRDIEDAIMLKVLSKRNILELYKIIEKDINIKMSDINNTVIIHNFLIDLCRHSDPLNGLRFSEKYLILMDHLKRFCYSYIYENERLNLYKDFAKLIIHSIFNVLLDCYKGNDTINRIATSYNEIYPLLTKYFIEWLKKYSNNRDNSKLKNDVIYDLENKNDYIQSIIDFISGMTDNFVLRIFDELTSF